MFTFNRIKFKLKNYSNFLTKNINDKKLKLFNINQIRVYKQTMMQTRSKRERPHNESTSLVFLSSY